MNILERFLSPRSRSQQEEHDTVLREYEESTRRLREKLDEDPCASDPTRERCAPDVADVLMEARRYAARRQ